MYSSIILCWLASWMRSNVCSVGTASAHDVAKPRKLWKPEDRELVAFSPLFHKHSTCLTREHGGTDIVYLTEQSWETISGSLSAAVCYVVSLHQPLVSLISKAPWRNFPREPQEFFLMSHVLPFWANLLYIKDSWTAYCCITASTVALSRKCWCLSCLAQ